MDSRRWMLCAAIAAAVALCGIDRRLDAQQTPTARRQAQQDLLPSTPRGGGYGSASVLYERYDELCRLYEEAREGIVEVVCEGERRPLATGSGFFVTESGWVVTSWHTIARPGVMGLRVVTADQRRLAVRVLAANPAVDLALLEPVEPVRVARAFAGAGPTDAQAGTPVLNVGSPRGDGLNLSHGVIRARRAPNEVQAALHGRLPLNHAYAYLETDVTIDGTTCGGPLLDSAGLALGVCSLRAPDTRAGFAVEWRAVEDLLEQADALAQPMELEDLRQWTPAGGGNFWRTMDPVQPNAVAQSVELVRRHTWCTRCHGCGMVDEQQTVQRIGTRRVIGTGRGSPRAHDRRRIVDDRVTVRVICPICHGRGIHHDVDKLYLHLTQLSQSLSALDNGPVAAPVRRSAEEACAEVAFNSGWFAGELVRLAQPALANPNDHAGEGVAFVGWIDQAAQHRRAALLVVRIHGSRQTVAVVCPDSLRALAGQYCLVSGVVRGVSDGGTLVVATTVTPIRTNPKLE